MNAASCVQTEGIHSIRRKACGTDAEVDEKTSVLLCTLGAKQTRTNQDILNEALLEHLKRLARNGLFAPNRFSVQRRGATSSQSV